MTHSQSSLTTRVHVLPDSAKQQWYSTQVSMLSTWLTERVDCSLHSVQLSALSQIVRVSIKPARRVTA